MTKRKFTRAKGKDIPPQEQTSQIKSKSKGNPQGYSPKGVESPQSQTKKGGKGPKNVYHPARLGRKNTSKGGQTLESGSKGKNGDKNGGKAKKGQK